MLLTKDYYRVAFENRLRTNQLGDVDDYNLKLAKLKNNSYPLPYSFKGDYTEHLAHENLFRRFGTVIHTEIEEGTVVCMDVMPEPEIVDENQSYPSPHEMRYPCLRCRSHKLAMLGKIPCSFVDDTRFDLAGYVYREIGHCFGRAEENICLNGVGMTEPKGLIHSAESGDCGNFFGAKVWYSNSKYRQVIWQCNHKFQGVCKCRTPHLQESVIQQRFQAAVQELLQKRKAILENCQVMLELLTDCTDLERQLQELETQKMRISEQVQGYVRENSEIVQDQEKYEERYQATGGTV